MLCNRCGLRDATGAQSTVTVDTSGNETRTSEQLCHECFELEIDARRAQEAAIRKRLEDGSVFEELREQLKTELAGKGPNPRLNFAPVSSAQSGLLRFASAWFVFNGVVYALLVVAAGARFVFSHEPAAPKMLVLVSLLVQAIAASGLIWTGLLFARAKRLGGYLAFGFVLLPVVFAAITREPLDIFDTAFAVLGVIVLVVIWHELS